MTKENWILAGAVIVVAILIFGFVSLVMILRQDEIHDARLCDANESLFLEFKNPPILANYTYYISRHPTNLGMIYTYSYAVNGTNFKTVVCPP